MNQSWWALVFKVGDKVLLSSAHIQLAFQVAWPSKKLQSRFIGLYLIVEIISPVAYCLALPPTLKIHLVFHVSLLKLYALPEAVPDREVKQLPPPAVLVDDHEEFEVEQILARRSHRR